jgi:hypothetical protein
VSAIAKTQNKAHYAGFSQKLLKSAARGPRVAKKAVPLSQIAVGTEI